MFGDQSKITSHVKKQENTNHNEGKENQSAETEPALTQTIELVNRHINTVIITDSIFSRS